MFTGSLVALVTPMNDDSSVDRESLKKLIDYHVKSGTRAIVSVGTTGESATLDHKEHIDVVAMTVDLAEGRIPVIAGAGANSTREAISLTHEVSRLDVVGCLTVTPYYNKPTQEGMYQHFKAIAAETDLPQILYNVPGRTGCDMKTETILRLAEIKNITCLKDATGQLSRVNEVLAGLNRDDFTLLSGDDASFLDFMQLGGHGVISVSANVAAKEIAEVCELCAAGEYQKARVLNRKLMPIHHDLFVESNPIPVKWACERLGMINNGTLRLPMTPLSEKSQPIVENALRYAGLL